MINPLLLKICSATALLFQSADLTVEGNAVAKCKKSTCIDCEPAPFFAQGLALTKVDPAPLDGHYAPGYSAAACPRVDAPWDLNLTASLIYWQPSQEAMDVAHVTPASGAAAGQVSDMKFGYQPGFKLGLGADTHFDHWTIDVDYTWFHHSTSSSAIATSGFSVSDWFQPTSANLYKEVNSIWGLHLDQIDLSLSRPYYKGAQLVIAPEVGIRALWLHQGLTVAMSNPTVGSSPYLSSTSHSHSWAVGTKAGITSKWMVWKGLRLDGTIGSSLLFTRYTSLLNSETVGISTVTSENSSLSALRPTLDMGLGVGYGAYLFKNRFFWDISARYDFAEYWSQNMMRTYASKLAGRNNQIGALSLHGLTMTMRCHF